MMGKRSEGKMCIRERIWDIAGEYVNDNTLTVYLKRLRDKIEDNRSGYYHLHTPLRYPRSLLTAWTGTSPYLCAGKRRAEVDIPVLKERFPLPVLLQSL